MTLTGQYVVSRIKELIKQGYTEDQIFNQLQIDELKQAQGVKPEN